MSSGLPPLLEGTAAVLAIALAATGAHDLTRRLLPGAPRSLVLTGAGVVWGASLYGAFRALAAIGLFGALPALVLFALFAALMHRRGREADRAETRPALRELFRELVQSKWGLAILPGTGLVVASILRGLAAPPLGWDALTYHLPRAGRWAASGHLAILDAPDAWGYYEWFPRAGDSYWAWAFLGLRDGGLLAAGGGVVLAAVALAAYALARQLRVERTGALLAAAGVALTPAVANALTVAYVDNTVLALVLAGSALLVDAQRAGRRGSAGLAGLAFGLATATKYSILQPLAGIGLVTACVPAPATRALRDRLRTVTSFMAAAAVPLVVECADRFVLRGSPFWPFRLAVGGYEIFPGNEELRLLLQVKLAQPWQAVFDPLGFLRWLLSPGRHEFAQSLGVGPVFPILFALAAIALARALRDPENRAAAATLAALALFTILGTLGEDGLALRTLWAQTYARFAMPAFAAAIVGAASLRNRWSRGALAAHALVGAGLLWPHGWGQPDAAGAARALVPVATGVALVWAASATVRRILPAVARPAVLAWIGFVPVLALLPPIRADVRYGVYEGAAPEDSIFDMHELSRPSASAWPIWKALDQETPRRIAVIAGWDGTGHNIYLYPLLGSRLQNEVVYVSPTRDGRVIDYRLKEDLDRAADHASWLSRLERDRIDVVVALAPPPPERAGWIEPDSRRFKPLAASPNGSSAAWVVRHAAATPRP